MKVLFAGTPGVRKSHALENLRAACQRLGQRVFTLRDTGKIPIVDRVLYGSGPIPFLQRAEADQKAKWQRGFRQILEEFDGARQEHHFLGAHLTYRFEQIPHCVISFAELVKWQPDAIVTFIDDAYMVRERIHLGGYRSFTLGELVLWRAEEVLIGDLLAVAIDPKQPPPNFVVPVNHPADMLARLLLNRNSVARVYMSHEITGRPGRGRTSESFRSMIDEFRQKARGIQTCAIFEPLSIDELPPIVNLPTRIRAKKMYHYDPGNPNQRWPLLDPKSVLAANDDLKRNYPLSIPLQELRSAAEAIKAQVAWRDIRLVEQSDCLVVYRPTLSGDRSLSTGVNTEVGHARATGRRVIWYLKKGDTRPTSPFVRGTPENDPDFIIAADESPLFEKLEGLGGNLRPDRDHFLRPNS